MPAYIVPVLLKKAAADLSRWRWKTAFEPRQHRGWVLRT